MQTINAVPHNTAPSSAHRKHAGHVRAIDVALELVFLADGAVLSLDHWMAGDEPSPPRPQITVAMIRGHVAAYYGLSELDLMSRRRSRTVARARQVVMYLARHLTRQSLPEIGRRLGDLDHTTVVHGVRRVAQLMLVDPDLAGDVRALDRGLRR